MTGRLHAPWGRVGMCVLPGTEQCVRLSRLLQESAVKHVTLFMVGHLIVCAASASLW